ncbi:MAG: SBBP repeat-containing protein [candidate division WOR-3 bacterium]
MKKTLIFGILLINFAQVLATTKFNWGQNNYIGFEENLGQITDMANQPVSSVLFRLSLPDYSIFLTEEGISFVPYKFQQDQINFARFDIQLVDGIIDKNKIDRLNEISGYNNYYLAHCPDGILFVKSYQCLKIKDIYPGINWVLRYGDKLHQEFEVLPAADVSQIKLKVKWADIEIKNQKEIIYSTPLGKIKEGEIFVHEKDGKVIPTAYKISDDGYITFEINKYDKSDTLLIDPPFERLWATYYGGTDQDNCDGSREIGAITTDNSGNIYVTGFTKSSNFPTQNPSGGAYFQGTNAGQIDAFILKFSNTGQREWATYYGGTADDIGISIATDYLANVLVTGNTFSSNFPTYNPGAGAYFQNTNGGSADAFVLKFNNNGIRQWATYYGGYSSDVGYSITTDGAGNIFITGNTYSSNFPTYDAGGGAYYQNSLAGGLFDAFILKFNNAGIRQWATYYGGNDEDHGYAIAADANGNIFITGMTRSTNFPILDAGSGAYFQSSILGYRTVFILKFNNNGIRQWATYYGGSTNDYGRAITTDCLGNVFVSGNTSSTNFPVYDAGGGAYFQANNAGSDDAFILKFNNNGVRHWATYYGGSSGDIARTITTDNVGNIFIAGNTLSSNFPTYNPGSSAYYQGSLAGGHEAFILGFNNAGIRLWGTFYGGGSTDYGMSIKTDASGNIFATGFTLSTNFPTYNPGGNSYYQANNAGSYDAYILKFASAVSGIEEIKQMISTNDFQLNLQPNPFKTQSIIRYSITVNEKVNLSVYDVSGKLVKNLINEFQNAGEYKFVWNGKDENNQKITNGIYFLILETPTRKLPKKLILSK